MSYHTSVVQRLTVQGRMHSSDIALTSEEITEKLEVSWDQLSLKDFHRLSNNVLSPYRSVP